MENALLSALSNFANASQSRYHGAVDSANQVTDARAISLNTYHRRIRIESAFRSEISIVLAIINSWYIISTSARARARHTVNVWLSFVCWTPLYVYLGIRLTLINIRIVHCNEDWQLDKSRQRVRGWKSSSVRAHRRERGRNFHSLSIDILTNWQIVAPFLLRMISTLLSITDLSSGI